MYLQTVQFHPLTIANPNKPAWQWRIQKFSIGGSRGGILGGDAPIQAESGAKPRKSLNIQAKGVEPTMLMFLLHDKEHWPDQNGKRVNHKNMGKTFNEMFKKETFVIIYDSMGKWIYIPICEISYSLA